MKRNRLAAILLCMMLLLAQFPLSASAAEEAVLSVGTAAGQRAETVEVDVSLSAVCGIASGGFNVVYDPAALELTGAAAGEALAGASAVINDAYGEDTVRVSFAGSAPLEESGVMLRLTFRIRDDAAAGPHSVSPEKVKLMDTGSKVVVSAGTAGSVTVRAASLALSSAECAPGQDIRLNVDLAGGLSPCGGSFELRYDPSVLLTASVQAEGAAGGAGVSLLANVDSANGRVLVTWASPVPVASGGRLCSVTFLTSRSASGETEVALAGETFYDENGLQAASSACVNGRVSFSEAAASEPMLYILGGRRGPEGTATVRIVMDARGLVCGGSFQLSYDAALCTLTGIKADASSAVTNPASAGEAKGTVSVAWMHASPAEEAESILELRFSLADGGVSELNITDVSLMDAEGKPVEAQVFGGKLGMASAVQCPAVTGLSPALHGLLFDAAFCTDTPTEAVKPVIAYYRGGQLLKVSMPEDVFRFGVSGIAEFSLPVLEPEGADRIRLFLFEPSGGLVPMGEAWSLELKA